MTLAIDMTSRIGAIDRRKLRLDRLARIRQELIAHDYGAALLADPINIRYATDTHTFNVWTLHAPGRYVFVPVDGPVVLFEYGTCMYLQEGLDSVDEVRKAVPWFYFLAGPRTQEKAELWSRDIIDLMRKYGGTDQRLAVDRCEPWGAKHLTDAGIQLFDAQEPLELARMIKTPEEIMALQLSMDVCDVGVDRIRQAIQPGLTENEVWSILHQTNIAHDGEWIECCLLTSGPRTNPWFQEASNRVIEAGDLVAFDTDMIGPLGYLADISRTYVCPGKAPTANQRKLYEIAQEQILTNIDLIKPGLSFKEFGEKCWPVPDEYVPNRYMMMIHGAGMVDEYPTVAYAADYADWGYDGEFLENMVVCVESYIGAVGGGEGVKLEQQVLITSAGAEPMSSAPLIDALGTMSSDPLLQRFTLKHLQLRNRVFSSSHEPAYSEDGMPKDRYRLYHVEKAKGGLALTMTAGTAIVSPDSPPAFGNLHAYDDAIVPWIQAMTDGIHEHGAAAMIQISHLGRRTGWGQDDWLPVVAPSPLREPAHRSHPKVAERWDIDRIIGEYADAAERMKAGGMDGIEIEAYGHLFDQFWSPATNHRDDEYGGSFEHRLRFPMEVLRAIRARVGPDYIVGIRMAIDERLEDGIDTPVGLEILRRLSAQNLIDFVNVIRGNIVNDAVLSEVIPIHGMRSAPHLDFAGMVRKETGIAVLHASKVDDVATARHAIAEGLVDMVGMTRAQMAEPHLVRKIQLGVEHTIRPCVGATYCLDRIYQSGEALCIHNAATGRELTMPHDIPRASRRRRIVVVGAGPGGLEAARISAERGHDVVLLEAMPWTGGQIRLAARNPRRKDLLGIVEWRDAELARLGVDVRVDTYADEHLVGDLQPDVVIVATGGLPQNPPLESGDDLVVNAWDVVGGDARLSGDVLLYDDDGTHSAMTTAEMLARSGARLEIVTPERTVGVDVGGLNMVPYARAFNETDTRISLNQRVRTVRREGGRLVVEVGSDHSPVRHTRVVDAVVVDHGVLANDELYHALVKGSGNGGEVDYAALLAGRPQPIVEDGYQLFRIGDAVAGRNIHAAIYDALRLCKDL